MIDPAIARDSKAFNQAHGLAATPVEQARANSIPPGQNTTVLTHGLVSPLALSLVDFLDKMGEFPEALQF